MGKSDTSSVYSGRSSVRSNVTASTNCHMPGKRKSLANKALIYLAGGNPTRHSHLRKDEMEDSTGHKKIVWYFVDYASYGYYEAFEYDDNESSYSSKSRKSKSSKSRRHRSSSRESFVKPRGRQDPDEEGSIYSSSDSDEESESDFDNGPQFMPPPPQHFPGHHQFPPQGPPPGFGGPQMHPGFGPMPPPPPPQQDSGTPEFFVIK